MRQVIMFFSGFLLCCFASFGQKYVGDQDDIDQILDNISNFSNNYMNLNYDAIAEAYTIDGMILPPGADMISGREAIKKRWTLPPGVKVPLHKITSTEIRIVDEYAYDIGYYEGQTLRLDGNEVSWKGKYMIVWQKVKGEWKIYADIWNRIDD